MYPKTKMHKILSITSGIIFGMQLVGFLSLFPTADEAAFLIQQKNYVLTEVNNIPFLERKYYIICTG